MPAVSRPAAPAAPSAAQKALQKMGLRRDIDLALHLPLRYEDETRITPLASARDGQTVQIEATVTACEVQLRPRRQLLVQLEDATGSCELRFFSFYPSHQKTMAVGNRLRIRGEVKGGFWGRQMLHPAFRLAGGELPAALTPVYQLFASIAALAHDRAGRREALPREDEPFEFFRGFSEIFVSVGLIILLSGISLILGWFGGVAVMIACEHQCIAARGIRQRHAGGDFPRVLVGHRQVSVGVNGFVGEVIRVGGFQHGNSRQGSGRETGGKGRAKGG